MAKHRSNTVLIYKKDELQIWDLNSGDIFRYNSIFELNTNIADYIEVLKAQHLYSSKQNCSILHQHQISECFSPSLLQFSLNSRKLNVTSSQIKVNTYKGKNAREIIKNPS